MSWLFSQALVAEFLADICLDGEPSAPSNGSHTPQAFCAPDKTKAFSRLSQFGMTFAPLTESRGEELLMSYRAVFRAKTSVLPGGGRELQVHAADSGKKWHELLAKYDPASSSWKTAQCSLLEDLEQSLEIWPRSGSMRNGACYQQPMLARLTCENASGLLPTPLASLATHGGPNQRDSNGRPGLQMAAMMWPTPKSNDAEKRGNFDVMNPRNGLPAAAKRSIYPTPSATDGTRGGVMTENMTGQSLTQVVNTMVRFPTPCATDHKGAGKSGTLRDRLDYAVERGATKSNTYATPQARDFCSGQTSRWEDPNRSRNLNDQIGGQLNPTWVEWLMGWPLGWTDLKPLETDRCHGALPLHSNCYEKG